ncbi:hypothetical protein DL764_000838 [Monosporascus ibericus]|uniref:Uncharacterized protein n=1 Tax=Monosporascus ibericus TaxID=155417 RepID=A0A4Q4TTL4_9PEZI|nr:hypothetical protein DL764_000838 [Monosporascus ibericus]
MLHLSVSVTSPARPPTCPAWQVAVAVIGLLAVGLGPCLTVWAVRRGKAQKEKTRGVGLDKMEAARFEKIRYKKQAERIAKRGPLRRAFQALFTTSQIGLGIRNIGIGKRSRREQSEFRDSLIVSYGGAREHPRLPTLIIGLHDVATGREAAEAPGKATCGPGSIRGVVTAATPDPGGLRLSTTDRHRQVKSAWLGDALPP